MADSVVLDASAAVDLLLGNELASAVSERLAGHMLQAPAHFDAEVLPALARLHRAKEVTAAKVGVLLEWLEELPLQRSAIAPLLHGAWKRRHNLSVLDALYVELAAQQDTVVVTTDRRLASAARGLADLVGLSSEH